MIKNYILDTNILLTNPNSIFGFADNNVVISGTTLQELDKLKALGGENGFAARECCRILDSLREHGDLIKGIKLDNGGTLFVEPAGAMSKRLPDGFSMESPDNRIISTGLFLKDKSENTPVILVTNDISMRVNASICGLQVESYKNDEADSTYLGYREIETEKDVIDLLYKEERVELKDVKDRLQNVGRKNPLVENEYLILKCGSQSVLGRVSKNGIVKIKEHTLFGSIKAKNVAQKFAIDALLAPPSEIPLVILIGPAGTAKTFLSLAAGLTQTKLGFNDDGLYNRILISRPNVITEEQPLGALPGTLEQKTSPLLACYYDNLDIILRGKAKQEDSMQIQAQIDDFIETGTIQICPLSFIRGRSLVDSYFICDEAQNASRRLIKDVITRSGTGTKIVICGDLEQIDSVNLDKRSNGLIFAAQRMAGSKLCAQVRFDSSYCVRSELSKEGITRLS